MSAGRSVPRVPLAHLPTPLVCARRLGEKLGIDLWIKRDDCTSGAESGNKIRKLEFLLADALHKRASVVITCGGIQSNHARATTLCAASLGMRAHLLLRVQDPETARLPDSGNVLLDRMAGARIRLISPEQYRDRNALMAEAATELERSGHTPYVIPEGGSNGRGALGYVEAMREIRAQLDSGLAGGVPFDVIVHACGSGGTAAGIALGASMHNVASEVRTMAVCDDVPTFEAIILRIIDEARALDPDLGPTAKMVVDDRARGPAYAVSTPVQRARMIETARLSGLVLDPVYTGKALSGMWDLCESGELRGKRVLFLHTGGLPGLLAQGSTFDTELA